MSASRSRLRQKQQYLTEYATKAPRFGGCGSKLSIQYLCLIRSVQCKAPPRLIIMFLFRRPIEGRKPYQTVRPGPASCERGAQTAAESEKNTVLNKNACQPQTNRERRQGEPK